MVIMNQKVAIYDISIIFGNIQYLLLKIKIKQQYDIKKMNEHNSSHQNMHGKHVYYPMINKKNYLYILQLFLLLILH